MSNPEGWSGGLVSGEVLFIGTMEGDLRALDTSSGRTQCTFEPKGEESQNLAFYGSPAVSEDTLFIGGYDGILYALPLDCNEEWELRDQEIVGTGEPIVGSPVVAGDLVLVGSSDGNLYAYEVSTDNNGFRLDERWRFPTGNSVWSTPAVADGVAYIGSLDHKVYAIGLEDGQAAWPAPFSAKGAFTATPAVAGGRLYVGAFDSVFYAIDAQTGGEVWRFEGATDWFWAKAHVTGDTVYAPSLDGKLYALDIDSGELRWSLETGGPVIGSPAIVGEWIAVPSLNNKVAAVHLVRLLDGGDQRRCGFGKRNKVTIRASLAADGNFLYLAATDHSVRKLEIDSRGNPEEQWVHFTDRDVPVDTGRSVEC